MKYGEPIDVILAFSPWDTWRDARVREFCRPPDQAFKSLVASPRVRKVLVADPWRSGPIDLMRRLQGRRVDFPTTDSVAHVRPLGLRRAEPVALAAIRRRYERYGGLLKRASQRRGLARPTVVTFNPFVAAYSQLEWCRRVVYYARDDWASFARNDGLRSALIEAQARIRSNGTAVCAVSRELADRVAGAFCGFVIQNAVDPETWSAVQPPPDALRALPRPFAAYAGTVDDRLDVAAVRSLARSGVLASIAIIGLVTDQSVANELATEPNVHLVGPMMQRELVGALMAADLCLLLHSVTDVTTAMSPLKLYEYLASGAPVLATDLPPIRGVDDDRIVLIDGGDYAEAAKIALAKGKLTETERLAVVRANSWEQRHELLIDVMSSLD